MALPRRVHPLQNISFWEALVFFLEALLFVFIGQQLPSILEGLGEYSATHVLLHVALVYAVLTGTRFLWFFTTPSLHPIFDRLLRDRYLRSPWQERFVLAWSGMRGAVSLAAAHAVPLTTQDGGPFPGRDLILFLTFSTILATLVLQGLTLGPIIAALRLRNDDEAGKLAELRARLAGACAALGKLDELCEDSRIPPGAQESMREDYQERIRRYTAGLEAGGVTEEYAESSAAWRGWRRELLAAKRETIVSLRDRGQITPEMMRRIMRDLDLEESGIGG